MLDPSGCTIRPATAADIPTLARHRAEMFRDMGMLDDDALYETMRAATATQLADALPAGRYRAWVAMPDEGPEGIVAGAGLLLREALPGLRRRDGVPEVAIGPQGIVMNVFTERPWRRRGLARRLMEVLLAGAREARVSHLVLHASDEGRGLYESLGFKATNEMRFGGVL